MDHQLAAVSTNYTSLKYIKHPSTAVQITALENNSSAINYIKHPSDEVYIVYVRNYLKNVTGFDLVLDDGIWKVIDKERTSHEDFKDETEFKSDDLSDVEKWVDRYSENNDYDNDY